MELDSVRHNIEIENKCLITRLEYEKICAFYHDRSETIKQINVYYDDENQRVQALKAVLRDRILTDGNTLTFKIEIDDKLHEFEKNDCRLDDEEFLDLLAGYRVFPPFYKQGEMTTYRRLIELPYADLCLDENHYNDLIDYEIEYEIKSDKTCLNDFIDLLKKVDIIYRPNSLSKYQRFLRSL